MAIISHYDYHDKYVEAREQAGDFMAAWRRSLDDYDAAMSMLKEANDLLRSAAAIAERDGEKTNWTAFRNKVKAGLKKQHKVLTAYYDKD